MNGRLHSAANASVMGFGLGLGIAYCMLEENTLSPHLLKLVSQLKPAFFSALMMALYGFVFSAGQTEEHDIYESEYIALRNNIDPAPRGYIAPASIAAAPENEHERELREAGFDGDYPQEFCDSIHTDRLMCRPVILVPKDKVETGERGGSEVVDASTYHDLVKRGLNFCPQTKQIFDGYIRHYVLENKIVDWVRSTVNELKKKCEKVAEPVLRRSERLNSTSYLATHGKFAKRTEVSEGLKKSFESRYRCR